MFNVGDKLMIGIKKGSRGVEVFKKGKVIGVYPSFVLIKFKNHKECFRHADLKNGLVNYKRAEG